MKSGLLLPLFVWQCSAEIVVSKGKLTNFSTNYSLSGSGLPQGSVNYQIQAKGHLQLDLFNEKLALSSSGEATGHVDCSNEAQAGQYRTRSICNDPILRAVLTAAHKGASELFVDGTAGIFGVRGHQAARKGGFGDAVSFCAVVKLPPHSLPPKSMLQQKLGSERFELLQQTLNSQPHVESDSVATFEMRDNMQEVTAKIHTDGADPVSFHIDGFQNQNGGSWLAHQIDLRFSGWSQVGSSEVGHFTCPPDASSDLAAHPQARHSLLSLNAMIHAMRQHQDLTWLPADPAAYFTEQLDAMHDGMGDEREHDHGLQLNKVQWMVVVAFLAGISGGGIVVALAKLTMPRQVPLLSDA